ncbi:MAG: DUF5685 family protein [Pseudobutyrivibrio sp.]|nr:DUF5685 family protein [Pseudobutyrivibrio sp.]
MFGYVNANRKQLSDDDKVNYQRFYCGLCQELHNQAGFKGQMLLNYDLCFLAILLQSLYEPEVTTKKFRCVIHPISPKHAYISTATEYAASMDIILSYHSLMDNYQDDNSSISGAAAASIRKHYNKVKAKYPRQTKAVEDYIEKLSAAEKRKETNIDVVSNYTGEMLACLFDWKEDNWSPFLRSIGFYLGKFIYIIDAYDDLKKDEKTGNYNPLLFMKQDCSKDFETFVRANLTSLIAECAKSFERLPIVDNADILRNIIYSGVWTRYEYLHIRDKKTEKSV